MIKRNLYYKLSPEFRFYARKMYYFPVDIFEKIIGNRDKLTPPKGDIFIGSGDFKKQGESQLHLLKKYIHLQPGDSVLDIGSGIGRTAVPLTKFLNHHGKYEGFDVVKKGVEWCNKNIHKRFPNFNFKYIPLNNSLYNSYQTKSGNFKFPYNDDSFDKAFLFSVFTHMKIEDIQNYLNEIHRVLKDDGWCCATFFTYDKSDNLENFPGFKFPFLREGYRLLDENLEEANIAIENEKLLEMIYASGLEKVDEIKGFWSDFSRKHPDRDFQDIIILQKKSK
ncbi:class I SAM-dependent methyltransferase [Chryseobacterium chendengshani]|uniref:class I SAM-dependent methyltransferase n=1 Tax=Chryseobacterium sp. LJ756 TaxID=2864113 RepID=UPI001C63CE77|nr:class I SAM-dependent methyltransferase [Chryseobacterium sp. LJ756]MBW7675135.1 class I SAM-dependent methyltransferase [Chryseobacterium sp. LJ756]